MAWLLLGAAVPTASWASLVTGHLPGEPAAIAVSEANGGAIRFTTEARIGRQGSDWEVGVRRHPAILNDGTSTVTNNDLWLNGAPIPFLLTYNGHGTVRLTLVLATVASQFTVIEDFDELFISTSATSLHSRIVVGNLVLNGVPVSGTASAIATSSAAQDVLRIQGGRLSHGFLLSGTISMAWTGSRPTGNQLDLKIWGARVPPPLADSTPPTVVLAEPLEGALLPTGSPQIAATYSDSGSGIDPASVRILLDGQNQSAYAVISSSSLSYRPASPLADGAHAAEVTVQDRNGNSGRATTRFTTDTLAPVLAITRPLSIVRGDLTPEIAVSYSDTTSGVDAESLRIQLDGTLMAGCTLGPASATCEPTPLNAGTHTVLATVEDRAGNVASATSSFELTLDGTPPAITVTTPPPGALLATSTPQISAVFSDAGSGVDPASVVVLLDELDRTGEALVTPNGLTFTPVERLGEGLHTAVVKVKDLEGNETQTSVSFTTDTGLPEVILTSPEAFVEDDPAPPISIAFSDSTSGVDPSSLRITLDGTDLTALCTVGAESATCRPAPLATGAHRVHVQARDFAGNAAAAATGFDVDLDDAPPVLVITEPSHPLVVGDSTPVIRVELSDPRSGIDLSSLRVALDGADLPAGCIVASDLFLCEAPELGRGDHEIVAKVRDRRGNLATASVGFRLTLPLEIAFSEPEPESVVGVPVVRVAGTVSPDATSVRVNGIEATLQGGTFALSNLGLHDGVNDLVAVALDAQGNSGTATVRVTADTTPPAISLQSPANGAVVRSADLAVAGRVNDLTIGTVSETEVTVTVNGAPAAVAHRSFLRTGLQLSPGPNQLEIVATDRAGNQTRANLQVTFDPPAGGPSIQIVAGNGQSGPVLSRLPEPLRVRVTDLSGQPLANVRVVFRVVQGSGALANGRRSQVVVSDVQGEAMTLWTLGSRAGVGVDRIRATAVGVAGEVAFLASAVAAPPAAIDVASGDEQLGAVGTSLSRPFVAVVTDGHQNPLAGVAVTFHVQEGGGHFAGTEHLTVETNESGLASALLVLGPSTESDGNVVEATFEGLTSFPATFRASGLVPGAPSETRIAGVVLDNQGEPVPGVTLRLRNSPLSAVSDEEGHFRLSGVPVGQVFLIADATTTPRPGTWASLEFELFTVAGVETTLPRPIYILPIDLPNGVLVDETHGGTLTLPAVPGFSLEILPGSVTFPAGSRSGIISVTAVHADKVPMAPGAGMQPRVIVTIQPAGAHFDPPARITFPNVDSLPPGTVTELFSFDHDLGAFVSIGTGTVSEDGRTLRSDPGFGVVEAGWHCGAIVGPNGQTANVSIKAGPTPVILLAGQTPPDHKTLGAGGLPPIDAVYSWKIDNPEIATLAPTGDGLCANQTFCNAEVTAASPGETIAKAKITCTTTGKTDEKKVRVVVAKVRVKEVSFGGTTYNEVKQDGTATPYNAPHWQDNSNPPDGDASDVDIDRNYPVAFIRKSKISVGAKFSVTPPELPDGEVMVRGQTSNDLAVPPTLAQKSLGTIFLPSIQMDGNLPATVAFLNPLTITWEVSFDGGRSWAHAGRSSTRIYVLWGQPITRFPLFETLLDIGCRNGAGQTEPVGLIDAIWADFSGPIPGVRRKEFDGQNHPDGAEMQYWVDTGDARLPLVQEACQTLSAMLKAPPNQLVNSLGLFNIGTCKAWAELFNESLRAQGVPGSEVREVVSNYAAPATFSNAVTATMLVKRWAFSAQGGGPESCGGSSAYLFPSQLTDESGVPGQGTPNPPSAFENHFLVVHDKSVYDPSYGTKATGSNLAEAAKSWEAASIDGYLGRCDANPAPDVVELVDIVRKDDPGRAEVNLLPLSPIP